MEVLLEMKSEGGQIVGEGRLGEGGVGGQIGGGLVITACQPQANRGKERVTGPDRFSHTRRREVTF